MAKTVKIYARNNAKPGNVELVTFFKSALPQLVAAGIHFDFAIAEERDFDALTRRGIDELPAAVLPDGKILKGSVDIKNAFAAIAQGRVSQPRPARGVSSSSAAGDPEEYMRDYYLSEMTESKAKRDAEEDEDDMGGMKTSDIQSRLNEEKKRRDEFMAKKTPGPSTSRRVDNVPHGASDDGDLGGAPPKRPRGSAPSRPSSSSSDDIAAAKTGHPDEDLIVGMFESSD